MNTGVNGMTHDMARLGFTQGQNAILFAELVEITNVKQENPDLNWGRQSRLAGLTLPLAWTRL